MMKSARSILGTVMALGLTVVLTPTGANAASHLVNPGESIQAAIDAASPGDVVKVNPGVYVETHGNPEAIHITKSLKLIARNSAEEVVRIEPGAGNTDGIVIEGTPEAPVNRVLIKGFTIDGFQNNGIWLKHANKFKLKNNVTSNNLENGIWPTLSANGLVKNNISYGAEDSGLWVEASENIRVIKNEIYNNPTGLEITISKKVFAKKNNIHDNTVGVGLYHPNGAGLVSPYPYDELGDWRIIGNTIVDNNYPNPVMGGLVGALPPGIGALVIGVDRVVMAKNEISGNTLGGIMVADWCIFNDCDMDPVVTEDAVDESVFIKNTATGNGTGSIDPDYIPFESDLLSFTFGTNNCYDNNTFGIVKNFFPGGPLPEC